VPLLLIIYPDYRPETVTSISLAVVWANATSGAIAYARQRRIDYVTGAIFAAASVPGVVGGALLVGYVSERLFSLLFAALLALVVAVLLRGMGAIVVREPLRGRGIIVRTLFAADGISYRYGYRVWQGISLSAAIGFISSLFGIGGGIVHVPAMIMLFRIPIPIAVATSHLVLAFMAGGATAIHLGSGTLSGEPLRQAIALGAGAVVGAQIGAWVSHRVSGQVVIRLLALALVALSIRLVLKAAGI
jgi:hypothetical protein